MGWCRQRATRTTCLITEYILCFRNPLWGGGTPNVKVGGLGRIHPLQTPACRKRRLMEGKVELSATKPTPPSVLSDEEGLLVTLQDEKQDLSKGGLSAHLANLVCK